MATERKHFRVLDALPEETEVDTPLAARCLQGLGLAYNGCGDAEAALEPLQAARRPSH